MTIHQRARALMNQSLCKEISVADRSWLDLHVESCADCTAHKQALRETINGIRHDVSEVMASASLVRATQSGVRLRAAQLRRSEERMSPLWIACAIACLWALLSIPLIWEGTSWIADHSQAPMFVWQTAAVLVWLMPSGIAVALGVWSRGMRAVEE